MSRRILFVLILFRLAFYPEAEAATKSGIKTVQISCGGDPTAPFAQPGTTIRFNISHTDYHFHKKPQVVVSPLLHGSPTPYQGTDEKYPKGYTNVAVSVLSTLWHPSSVEAGTVSSHKEHGKELRDCVQGR